MKPAFQAVLAFLPSAHEDFHHGGGFQSVRPEGRFHRDLERRPFLDGGAVRERMGRVAGRGFHGVPGPHEEIEADIHDPDPGRLAGGRTSAERNADKG